MAAPARREGVFGFFKSFVLWTVRLACAFYVAAYLIWIGWWLSDSSHPFLVVVINRVGYLHFFPSFVVFLMALATRTRLLAVAALIPITAYYAIMWPYLVPRPAPTNIGEPVRVMTYNVLCNNLDFDAISAAIEVNSPDLVALQEVRPDTLPELQQRLEENYPHSYTGGNAPCGNPAIFSRTPLETATTVDLGIDRPAAVVTTSIHGEQIAFASIHLYPLFYPLQEPKRSWPDSFPTLPSNQELQIETLLANLPPTTTTIIGCDCNSNDFQHGNRLLRQQFTNSSRAIGWRPGSSRPADTYQDLILDHVDFVWYRGNLEASGVYRMRNSGGSDHQPVIADLAIQDSEA